jgi:hypothetical protein
MNITLTQRAEIMFWNVWINLLTQSRLVQNVVKKVYFVRQRKDLVILSALVATGAVSGLTAGMLLYVVSFMVR